MWRNRAWEEGIFTYFEFIPVFTAWPDVKNLFRALQTTFESVIDSHSLSCNHSQSKGKLSDPSLHKKGCRDRRWLSFPDGGIDSMSLGRWISA
jgi:hypothetical protein